MKKIISIMLSAMLVLSITGCSTKPSEEKIKAALEEGTISFEDAKAKGWIDDEWVNKNYEKVDAGSKIHVFNPFETTYLDGATVSSNIIAGKICLVFFNTEKEKTMEQLSIFNNICEEMKNVGIPVLGVITNEDVDAAKESLSDIKFPIIVYNEEMQNSLKKYNEIIDTDIVSVFTKDGGFYSAWNNSETADSLLKFAKVLANEE